MLYRDDFLDHRKYTRLLYPLDIAEIVETPSTYFRLFGSKPYLSPTTIRNLVYALKKNEKWVTAHFYNDYFEHVKYNTIAVNSASALIVCSVELLCYTLTGDKKYLQKDAKFHNYLYIDRYDPANKTRQWRPLPKAILNFELESQNSNHNDVKKLLLEQLNCIRQLFLSIPYNKIWNHKFKEKVSTIYLLNELNYLINRKVRIFNNELYRYPSIYPMSRNYYAQIRRINASSLLNKKRNEYRGLYREYKPELRKPCPLLGTTIIKVLVRNKRKHKEFYVTHYERPPNGNNTDKTGFIESIQNGVIEGTNFPLRFIDNNLVRKCCTCDKYEYVQNHHFFTKALFNNKTIEVYRKYHDSSLIYSENEEGLEQIRKEFGIKKPDDYELVMSGLNTLVSNSNTTNYNVINFINWRFPSRGQPGRFEKNVLSTINFQNMLIEGTCELAQLKSKVHSQDKDVRTELLRKIEEEKLKRIAEDSNLEQRTLIGTITPISFDTRDLIYGPSFHEVMTRSDNYISFCDKCYSVLVKYTRPDSYFGRYHSLRAAQNGNQRTPQNGTAFLPLLNFLGKERSVIARNAYTAYDNSTRIIHNYTDNVLDYFHGFLRAKKENIGMYSVQYPLNTKLRFDMNQKRKIIYEIPKITKLDSTLFMGVELEVTANKRSFDVARQLLLQEASVINRQHVKELGTFIAAGTVESFLKTNASGIIKNDGSVSEIGFEIVSVPGTHQWHLNEGWQGFFKEDYPEDKQHLAPSFWLSGWVNNRLRIKSPIDGVPDYETPVCGIHIHVSKNALTPLQLGKILLFVCNNEESNKFVTKLAGRNETSYALYGKKNLKDGIHLNKVGQIGASEVFPRTSDLYTRYSAINIGGSKNTIEFRVFRSNVSKAGFFKNLDFVKALCDWTKETSASDTSLRSFLSFVIDNRGQYTWLLKWLVRNNYLQPINKPNPKAILHFEEEVI